MKLLKFKNLLVAALISTTLVVTAACGSIGASSNDNTAAVKAEQQQKVQEVTQQLDDAKQKAADEQKKADEAKALKEKEQAEADAAKAEADKQAQEAAAKQAAADKAAADAKALEEAAAKAKSEKDAETAKKLEAQLKAAKEEAAKKAAEAKAAAVAKAAADAEAAKQAKEAAEQAQKLADQQKAQATAELAASTLAALKKDAEDQLAAAVLPSTLNVGYVSANKLNLPAAGPEGYGFFTGKTQELLKKYNVTQVNFTGLPSGVEVAQAVLAGRLDIGIIGDTPAISIRAKTGKTHLLSISRAGADVGIVGQKGATLTEKDLAGKTIGLPKGTVAHRYVAGVLDELGIKDAKIVQVGFTEGEAALANGSIDAFGTTGPGALFLETKGYSLISLGSRDHKAYTYDLVTIVNDDYLAKAPDFPRIWNGIRKEVVGDIRSNNAGYFDFIGKITGYPEDLIKKAEVIGDYAKEPFTEYGKQLFNNNKKFLFNEKLIPNDFNLDDYIAK